MGEQRCLSLRLYEVLEMVGASERMRNLHTRTGMTYEILSTIGKTVQFNQLTHDYVCGSRYEGSVTPDLLSDTDVINGLPYMHVVSDPHTSLHGWSLCMVNDEWTYPGYLKLQWVYSGNPLIGNDVYLNSKIDAIGRVCFQHISNTSDSPAIKKFGKNGVHDLDCVVALRCKSLPLCASNRFNQIRKRGIISGEDFESLVGMGCMFVCAGYFQSSERKTEWRLSLSLQERHFMSKLNPTQHKVYILLKMIRKNILEKTIGGESLTSYHCKTCVLYAIEMTPARSWTPENLLDCLMQCIKLLILWLKTNYCPNYFNRDQNLFSKKGFAQLRKPLLHTMELLLLTNNRFLLLIQSDFVGNILMEGEGRFKNEIDMKKNEYTFKIKRLLIGNICFCFNYIMANLCRGRYDPFSLNTALQSLRQIDTVPEHTAAETQTALAYVLPWFHLHIAKSAVCLFYSCRDRSYRKQIMEVTEIHFREAHMTDLVNVRLANAAILYRSEHYATCFVLLQYIEDKFTSNVVTVCPCVAETGQFYYDRHDQFCKLKAMSDMSVRQIMRCLCACCVMFLPSECDIVPAPLRYEMIRSSNTEPGSRHELKDFWFDWAIVDAKVFLWFMKYLVSEKLQRDAHKQAAMDNIRAEIEQDDRLKSQRMSSLFHKETACNLLGWIYIQEQRYGDAAHCLSKSWKIRPFHNAAKFHMRDLLEIISEIQGQNSDQSCGQ